MITPITASSYFQYTSRKILGHYPTSAQVGYVQSLHVFIKYTTGTLPHHFNRNISQQNGFVSAVLPSLCGTVVQLNLAADLWHKIFPRSVWPFFYAQCCVVWKCNASNNQYVFKTLLQKPQKIKTNISYPIILIQNHPSASLFSPSFSTLIPLKFRLWICSILNILWNIFY